MNYIKRNLFSDCACHCKFNLRLILTSGIICILSLMGYPQDNHYWSQQYGARANLMGGAMIGEVRDNSAIFYNPGAVPFIKYPGLSVNANIYKIDRIFIEDGAGEGVNLNSAKTSFPPRE